MTDKTEIGRSFINSCYHFQLVNMADRSKVEAAIIYEQIQDMFADLDKRGFKIAKFDAN